jgi:hypothetical protein
LTIADIESRITKTLSSKSLDEPDILFDISSEPININEQFDIIHVKSTSQIDLCINGEGEINQQTFSNLEKLLSERGIIVFGTEIVFGFANVKQKRDDPLTVKQMDLFRKLLTSDLKKNNISLCVDPDFELKLSVHIKHGKDTEKRVSTRNPNIEGGHIYLTKGNSEIFEHVLFSCW